MERGDLFALQGRGDDVLERRGRAFFAVMLDIGTFHIHLKLVADAVPPPLVLPHVEIDPVYPTPSPSDGRVKRHVVPFAGGQHAFVAHHSLDEGRQMERIRVTPRVEYPRVLVVHDSHLPAMKGLVIAFCPAMATELNDDVDTVPLRELHRQDLRREVGDGNLMILHRRHRDGGAGQVGQVSVGVEPVNLGFLHRS